MLKYFIPYLLSKMNSNLQKNTISSVVLDMESAAGSITSFEETSEKDATPWLKEVQFITQTFQLRE